MKHFGMMVALLSLILVVGCPGKKDDKKQPAAGGDKVTAPADDAAKTTTDAGDDGAAEEVKPAVKPVDDAKAPVDKKTTTADVPDPFEDL